MKSFYATVIVLMGVAVVMFAAGQPAFADVTVGDPGFEGLPLQVTATYTMNAPWMSAPASSGNYAGEGAADPATGDPWFVYGNVHGHGAQQGFVEGQSSFYQDLAGFVGGGSYTVKFWSSGGSGNVVGLDWSSNPVQVTVGSTTLTFLGSASVTPPNAGQWYTSDVFTAPAEGVNRLTFTGLNALTSPYPMSGIDDVSVQTVPEPSTLILLAFGLIGAAAYIRRRR